jgi:hypothetical protein
MLQPRAITVTADANLSGLSGMMILRKALALLWRKKRDAVLTWVLPVAFLSAHTFFSKQFLAGAGEMIIAVGSYVWFLRVHEGQWPSRIVMSRVLYLFWAHIKITFLTACPVIFYTYYNYYYDRKIQLADVGILIIWLCVCFWIYQRVSLCFPFSALRGRMLLRDSFRMTRGHDGAFFFLSTCLLLVYLVTVASNVMAISFANIGHLPLVVNLLGTILLVSLACAINSEIYNYFEPLITAQEAEKGA